MPTSGFVNPYILGVSERNAETQQMRAMELQQKFAKEQAAQEREFQERLARERNRILESLSREQLALQRENAERLTGLQQLELLSKGVEVSGPEVPGAVKIGTRWFRPLTPREQLSRALELENIAEEERQKGRAIIASKYLKDDPHKDIFVMGGPEMWMAIKNFSLNERRDFINKLISDVYKDPSIVKSPGFRSVLLATSQFAQAQVDPITRALQATQLELAKRTLSGSDPAIALYASMVRQAIPQDAFGRANLLQEADKALAQLVQAGKIPADRAGEVAAFLASQIRIPVSVQEPVSLESAILGALAAEAPPQGLTPPQQSPSQPTQQSPSQPTKTTPTPTQEKKGLPLSAYGPVVTPYVPLKQPNIEKFQAPPDQSASLKRLDIERVRVPYVQGTSQQQFNLEKGAESEISKLKSELFGKVMTPSVIDLISKLQELYPEQPRSPVVKEPVQSTSPQQLDIEKALGSEIAKLKSGLSQKIMTQSVIDLMNKLQNMPREQHGGLTQEKVLDLQNQLQKLYSEQYSGVEKPLAIDLQDRLRRLYGAEEKPKPEIPQRAPSNYMINVKEWLQKWLRPETSPQPAELRRALGI